MKSLHCKELVDDIKFEYDLQFDTKYNLIVFNMEIKLEWKYCYHKKEYSMYFFSPCELANRKGFVSVEYNLCVMTR